MPSFYPQYQYPQYYPQQQVQELLNSGRITQQQYDAAVQAANQIRNIVGL